MEERAIVRTIGHLLYEIEEPFEQENVEIIRRRLEDHPEELKIPLGNNFKRLPLHLLCIQEDDPPFELAQAFVEAYPEGLQRKDNAQDTPLQLACWFNSPAIAQCYLDAYPGVANVTGNLGFLPLVVAASRYTLEGGKGWMKIVLDLIQYYPQALVEAKDVESRSLFQSIWTHDFETPFIHTNNDAGNVVERSVDVALVFLVSTAILKESENVSTKDNTTSGLVRDWFLSLKDVWQEEGTSEANNDHGHFYHHSPFFRSTALHHLALYGHLLGIPFLVAKRIVDLYPYQLFQTANQHRVPESINTTSTIIPEKLPVNLLLQELAKDDSGHDEQNSENNVLVQYMKAQHRNFSFFMLRMNVWRSH